MAVHPHNTPSGVDEPGLPPAGLLRSRGAPCRVFSHGEMLALLDGEKPELPLLGADVRHSGAHKSAPSVDLLPETEEQKLARALHARRALYDALEHGFALLDAIGLSPLALDVIDDGIAALDRMDAAAEDLEDDGTLEEEPDAEDNGDKEPSLAAPENQGNQISWACSGDHDRELDDSDLEDGFDPSWAVLRPRSTLLEAAL